MVDNDAVTKAGHESKDQEAFERVMFGVEKYMVFTASRAMVDAYEDVVLARAHAKAVRGYVKDLSGRIYPAAR